VSSRVRAASFTSRRPEVEPPIALTTLCGGANGELPAMTMVTSASMVFAASWLDGDLVAEKEVTAGLLCEHSRHRRYRPLRHPRY